MYDIKNELLIKAVDHSPAMIVITDKNGVIEYVNNKFVQITQYTYNEVIGRKPNFLKSGFHDDSYYKEMWGVINKGEEWKGEFYNRKKNGEFYWERLSISSFKDEKGNILKFVAIKEDVTEIKKTEKKLKLRDFSIEKAKDGMMWLDNNANVIYSNNSYCDLLNEKKDEITNLNWFDVIPNDNKDIWQEYWEMLKNNKTLTLEHTFNHKNENIIVESTLNYFQVENEEFIFIFTRDVTEKIKIQEKLRHSEEKFSKIFSSSPDAIAITDLKTSKFIDVNEAFIILSGWKKSEVIGKTIFDLNLWKNPKKRNYIRTMVEKQGYFHNFENVFILKSGEKRTGLMAGRLIEYNKERYLLTITKDISERKEFENELEEAKNKAEESDKLKSNFLSNMSHEIRTPLNVILGFVDLLKEKDLSDVSRKNYIKIIDDSSNDLLKIIENIIDISKINTGQILLKKDKCYIGDIMISLYEEYKEKCNEKGLELICESCVSKNELYVYIDKYRVKQVLFNLLDNATKFTEKGYIEFGYEIENNHIQFYVEDTGIGIHKENIDLIFKQFRQVDDSQTRKYGGNGLGLTISKKLVEIMNGDIWVESEINIGSTFYFEVPIHE